MARKVTLDAKKKKAKILIVDDHPILRQGLSQLINQEEDLSICGEAKDAQQGMDRISRLNPDLAIIDITLEGIDGLELIKLVKSRFPKLPILVLSMHDEAIYAERALRAGARGYIMKQEASDVIISAIRKVLKGEIHVSSRMASRLLNKVADGRADRGGSAVEELSDRELEVFTLIGQGLGTRKIAEKLCLSIKTVETYREHIKNKMELANATELVRQAVKWVESERS